MKNYDHEFDNRLHKLRKKVENNIAYRDKLSDGSLFYPSGLWRHANNLLTYFRYLPFQEAKSIRLHANSINGQSYITFAFDPHRDVSDEEKLNEFWPASHYNSAIQGLPERYHISEPAPNYATERDCLPFKSKLLSHDLARYQRFIKNLFNLGIFQEIGHKRSVIFEIGSGYGSLAYHLHKVMCGEVTLVLTDTPEMLYFAGVFLSLNAPESNIFIYDSNSKSDLLSMQEILQYDFVLIPNYALEKVIGTDIEIDLAINLFSFQEMKTQQVEFYIDFISERLVGYIASENMPIHPNNPELELDIEEMLRRKFLVFPSEKDMVNIKNRIESYKWQTFILFGTKIDSPSNFSVSEFSIQGLGYEFHFNEIDYFESCELQSESNPISETEDSEPVQKSRRKNTIWQIWKSILRHISKG